MRTCLALAVLLACCADPAVELPPAVPLAALAAVSPEGDVPSVVRFTITSTGPLIEPRVVVVTGGASADDLAAYARNRLTAALRARELPTSAWSEGDRWLAQPTRALPAGRHTLVVLQERRAPLAHEFVARATPFVERVWTTERSVTHCSSIPPDGATTVTLAPAGVEARVVRRGGCFDVVGAQAITSLVLPPTLGAIALDPAPIGPPEPPPLRPEPPCPEGAYALGPLCVRVDDDRIVLVGGAETRRLVIGSFGPIAFGATLAIGARHVLRGFPPRTEVPVDLLVRDALGDHRVRQTLATRPPRRHVVINEILARPPSGASTQRFLELVNDGETAVDLAGLVLHDGDDAWELPDTVVPPAGYVLVTPSAYVDGLAGEPAPPKGVDRVLVDSLRLSGELTLAEPDGAVLSRFPPTTSTKQTARARRTPDTPDDAPEAFVFAPPTPGRANVVVTPP